MPRPLPLIGRDLELSRLRAIFDATAKGGSAVLLTGDAGIGKSALIDELLAEARESGASVLRASGVESEAQLPFAALDQLLRPVLDRIRGLPDRPRELLMGALGHAGGAAPEPYLIGLATLDLLGDVASAGPLCVVIDDAQWVDASTAQVLAFVARRLESDPVLMLLVMRPNVDSTLLAAGLDEIELQPLDASAARSILGARRPALSEADRDRLLARSAGNPLALIELPASEREPEAGTLNHRLVRAFGDRLTGLTPATRAVLLVAALDDRDQTVELLAAAREYEPSAGVSAEALDAAIERRIVTIEGDHLVFRHPVMRSTIVQSASPAERRRAHRALAEVLADRPDQSVWHRAAELIEPDEDVAAALETASGRAAARGNSGVSLLALERAATLSENAPARLRRLLGAAELALELGQMQRAAALAAELDELAVEPVDRARYVLVHDAVDPASPRDTHRMRTLVQTATSAAEAGETALALRLLYAGALSMWWGDAPESMRREVIEATQRLDVEGDPLALAVLAQADPASWASAVLDAVAAQRPETLDAASGALLGTAFLVGGADRGLSALQAALADGLRLQGRIRDLPAVLSQQTWTSINLADWATALPAADEGVRLGRETGQPMWLAASQIGGSMIAALRGDHELSNRLAGEAEAAVLPLGVGALLSGIQLARGVSAIARGSYDEAFAELRREFTESDPAFHQFQNRWAFGDLAEAGFHAGRIDELRAIAARSGAAVLTPWHRVAAEYAAPFLVEDDDSAGEAFESALRGEVGRWPTYRVRMLIEYGSWLRRHRLPVEARDRLREARTAADALGLVPWAERARRELRAAGERSDNRQPAAWENLSAQELQVARLAAVGLSNREIGQRLFLSHRTVGSHLYRLFPKLGVTTRAQLAATVAEADLASG